MCKPILNIILIFIIICCFTNSYADEQNVTISDPTRPPGYVAPGATNRNINLSYGLHLTFILNSKSRRYAIINNVVVYEGDVIAGYQVVAIKNNSVIVKDKKGEKTIPLIKDMVKSETTSTGAGSQ